jgi:hypothetical protein
MGRLLTSKRIAELADQAQVELTVQTLASPYLLHAITQDGPVSTRIVRRTGLNQVFRQVTDIYGRHALLLRVDVPRSITAKGLAATRFALRSLLIVGVLVLFVLIVAIRQMTAIRSTLAQRGPSR